eukprot:s1062_g21.t1
MLQPERICGTAFPRNTTQEAVQCFCFMSGQCESPCKCFQGCASDVVVRHRWTATFKNVNDATSCGNQTSSALLTIPREYFRSIDHLWQACSAEATYTIVEETCGRGHGVALRGTAALMKSFEEFQNWSAGPVRQCIHAPWRQTVQWMHIHTLCGAGMLDGMPGSTTEAWCGDMATADQAASLARKMLQWAQGSKQKQYLRASADVTSNG